MATDFSNSLFLVEGRSAEAALRGVCAANNGKNIRLQVLFSVWYAFINEAANMIAQRLPAQSLQKIRRRGEMGAGNESAHAQHRLLSAH